MAFQRETPSGILGLRKKDTIRFRSDAVHFHSVNEPQEKDGGSGS